jgi:hypothetical protein
MKNLESCILFLALASGLLQGCVVLNDTANSGIAGKCYAVQVESVLYTDSCPACEPSLTMAPSEFYSNKKWNFLDGSTRKRYSDVHIGEKLVVLEVKKAFGITDGPPFYVKGKLINGLDNEVFELTGYYFSYMDYPTKPTSRLKPCPE